MIKIGGVSFYINFEGLDALISSDKSLEAQEVSETSTKELFDESGKTVNKEITVRKYPKGKEIDGARYDCLGSLLEIILNGEAEIDDSLGIDRALNAMPLNWKIAFNTLTKYEILKSVK